MNQTKPIDFMKYRYWYFAISSLFIIPGLISLIMFGLKPAIDFTGGSLVELQLSPPAVLSETQLTQSLPEGISAGSIQSAGNNQFLVRTSPMTRDQNQAFQANLVQLLAGKDSTSPGELASAAALLSEKRFETLGPTLGRELLNKTFISIILAAGAILLYVAYRFNDIKYGVSAIIAMFHDTFILIGIFSLLGHFFDIEVDTLFVTALLTTLSFSVHDTIVVYDRIRESLAKDHKAGFYDTVNKSVTETLSRSINNSMTIIFMLLALWLLGGETVKWFVFALLVGTIVGTYSSTFTAAPLLVVWQQWMNRRKRKPALAVSR